MPLIFGGVLLAAWIDDFQRIGGWTARLCWRAGRDRNRDRLRRGSGLGAARRREQRRASSAPRSARSPESSPASGAWSSCRWFGAAIGEFIAQRDALRAGKVGLATWLGLLLGTVVKIAIAFTMIGVFVAALLI